jgi:hypothetical protein
LRRALALPLVLCAACNTLDASRPIAIFPPEDFTPQQNEALRNAAECWNMQFGTQFVFDGASDPEQTIDVAFNDLACASGHGRTDPWLPVQISLCKPDLESDYFFFRTTIHELGHALNILSHADDPQAIMGTDARLARRFADADCDMFYAANPDMPRTIACGAVFIPFITLPRCSLDP